MIFRPGSLLRTEGLFVLSLTCALYHHWFPHHWLLFACLFLVPDVSLIPYAFGLSSAANGGYNAAHSYVLPLTLGVLYVFTGNLFVGEAGLIWMSHIGMDRALGYGLKYPMVFRYTHIQAADRNISPSDR